MRLTPLHVGRAVLMASVCQPAMVGLGIPGSLTAEFQGARYNVPDGFQRTEAVLLTDPTDISFDGNRQLAAYAQAYWGGDEHYITVEHAMCLPPRESVRFLGATSEHEYLIDGNDQRRFFPLTIGVDVEKAH